jgi:hypothetical protein
MSALRGRVRRRIYSVGMFFSESRHPFFGIML